MHIGDHVKLHIDPGRKDTLEMPENVGTVRAIDADSYPPVLLLTFAGVAVYTSAITDSEIEILRDPSESSSLG